MEMKQKSFNFTDRTVELLKIVSALNKTSETETLEIALELMATPEVLTLINSIHGERVDRKTLRKPRTSKKKVKSEPMPIKKETAPLVEQDNPPAPIVEDVKETVIENIEEIHQENKSYILEETEEIKEAPTYTKVEEEDASDSMLDLNACDDDLLNMYA